MPDTIEWLQPKGARVTKTSPMTGQQSTMDLDITQKQWEMFQAGGTLIQRCFPQLTPSEREFLQTGLTQANWEAIFGKKADD